MRKIVNILVLVNSLLAAMEDPALHEKKHADISQSQLKSKSIAKKNNYSFLSVLPAELGTQLIPPYASVETAPRDNRRDLVIERGKNLSNFMDLAKEVWSAQVDERPIVDAIVAHMRAHPQEESHFKPNVFSVTSALQFSQERMKEALMRRLDEFNALSQKDKDTVIVDTIKVCPFLEIIQPMIKGGATVHAQDAGSRSTLLHYAVRDGDSTLVDFLLENKAYVDAIDRLDSTPLHYAVHSHNIDAAKLLVKHGAKVNLWDWQKNSPFYYAVLHDDIDMTQLLLKHGAVIYYNDLLEEDDTSANNDIFEKNVLALAVAHNSIPLLKLLLENRQSSQPFIDLLENMLNAALCVAAGHGFHQISDFLIFYIDLIKTRPLLKPDLIIKDHSSIGYALLNDHYWLAYKLLTSACNEHYTPHCHASRRDSLQIAVEKICQMSPQVPYYEKKNKKLTEIINLLLKEGAEPVTGLRPSPAFIAAKYKKIPLLNLLLFKALEKDYLAPCKLMFDAASAGCAAAVHSVLQFSIPPTITDRVGDTPLHKAVLILDVENVPMIDYLVACGADVVAKNNTKEETPLHYVMRHPNKNEQEEVVKKLIEQLKKQNKINQIDAINKEGNTPLMNICASQKFAGAIVKLLVENGAQINRRNEKGQTALFISARQNSLENVQELLAAGADPDATNNDGCGPLTKAARNGNWIMITALLKANATLDRFKNSMLREAAKGGHIKIIDWLLKYDANINGKSTSYGNTPLHKAVQYRQFDTVNYLLEKGADVMVKNNKCMAPLDIATSLPDQECASMLQIWLHKKKKDN